MSAFVGLTVGLTWPLASVFRTVSYETSYMTHSARYQLFQMTHGKGIASGHLSREFVRHPVFPALVADSIDGPVQPRVLVDGHPANRYANAEIQLAQSGYRYVVLHEPASADIERGSPWGWQSARAFVAQVFRGRQPVVADGTVTVYAVDPSTDVRRLVPSIVLGASSFEGWLATQSDERWLQSPGLLEIATPVAETVAVAITADRIYDSWANRDLAEANLAVASVDGDVVRWRLRAGQAATVSLALPPGIHAIGVRVERSSSVGKLEQWYPLRIAVRRVELLTRSP